MTRHRLRSTRRQRQRRARRGPRVLGAFVDKWHFLLAHDCGHYTITHSLGTGMTELLG